MVGAASPRRCGSRFVDPLPRRCARAAMSPRALVPSRRRSRGSAGPRARPAPAASWWRPCRGTRATKTAGRARRPPLLRTPLVRSRAGPPCLRAPSPRGELPSMESPSSDDCLAGFDRLRLTVTRRLHAAGAPSGRHGGAGARAHGSAALRRRGPAPPSGGPAAASADLEPARPALAHQGRPRALLRPVAARAPTCSPP